MCSQDININEITKTGRYHGWVALVFTKEGYLNKQFFKKKKQAEAAGGIQIHRSSVYIYCLS